MTRTRAPQIVAREADIVELLRGYPQATARELAILLYHADPPSRAASAKVTMSLRNLERDGIARRLLKVPPYRWELT